MQATHRNAKVPTHMSLPDKVVFGLNGPAVTAPAHRVQPGL